MRALALPLLFSVAALSVSFASTARADDDDPPPAAAPAPPPPPAPTTPPAAEPWPLPPNVNVAPNSDVTVTRTDGAGVDVHAQTPSGTVHAYSCSAVKVDGTSPGAVGVVPCPPGYAPPPAYAYPYPYAYPAYYYPPRAKPKPKYAPDPTRRGMLIASSLAFGLGTVAAGTAYVTSASMRSDACTQLAGTSSSCDSLVQGSKPALYTMGGFLTLTPSLPRLVMGDVGMAVLYTALRGGSFAAGAFIDWKDKTYTLPVTFALVVPLALGIVDLATTPHRENLEAREKEAAIDAHKVKLRAVGPSVALDKKGAPVPTVSALATF